jgi:hypothetical protein
MLQNIADGLQMCLFFGMVALLLNATPTYGDTVHLVCMLTIGVFYYIKYFVRIDLKFVHFLLVRRIQSLKSRRSRVGNDWK